MTNIEMRRYANELDKLKVLCRCCGHKQIIPVFKDSGNCSYCGKKLDNNTRYYFKYKMRKLMNL